MHPPTTPKKWGMGIWHCNTLVGITGGHHSVVMVSTHDASVPTSVLESSMT